MFYLLTAHSRAVQRTAYTILHRYIPHAQEQVSFDVALSKTAVCLPDELMSLLIETPSMQAVQESSGDDKMWTSMRSYLLSWKVLFDHFSNAVSFSGLPLTFISQIILSSRCRSRNTTPPMSKRTMCWFHCWSLPANFSRNHRASLSMHPSLTWNPSSPTNLIPPKEKPSGFWCTCITYA